MSHVGNQPPQGGYVDGDVPVPPSGAELSHAIDASMEPAGHTLGHSAVGPSVTLGQIDMPWPHEQHLVSGEGLTPHTYTDHPDLVPVVDYLALTISERADRSFRGAKVLRAAEHRTGRELSSDEAHEFLALLAIHPNVTPLETGGFQASEEPEFTPLSKRFWDDEYMRTPEPSGRPMFVREVIHALHATHRSAAFRAAKAAANRIANPPRRSRQPDVVES